MADHLTSDQFDLYVKRALSPAELIAASAHLASCEPCRQRASDPQKLDAVFSFLCDDLETQAKLGPTHIEYEQLEAYVDGEMDQPDREIVDSHVELCRMCREELHDLQKCEPSRTYVPQMPGVRVSAEAFVGSHFGQYFDEEGLSGPLTIHAAAEDREIPEPEKAGGSTAGLWETVSQFWRSPGYLAGLASAIAIVLVIVWIAVWIVPSRRYVAKAPNAGHTPGSVPGLESQQELQTPAALAGLVGKTGTLLGSATQSAQFALLTPVGTFVEDERPTFRWQPLPGATSYQITVFAAALNEVAASPAISATEWKASIPLERGKVYLWQVAATRGGEQVVAPAPPAPEAKFEILDLPQANSLEQLRREQPNAHFTLGRAYARSGVLDEAEREFRLVSDSDADYASAQRFMYDLEALRQPDTGNAGH